ncbi:MAG: hypothetical protein KBF93_23495 [Leptospiraceae bacterium]|nr:hypothetical protein [Leptospiraceae bacterium]
MFTFIDAAALLSVVILAKTYTTSKNAYAAYKAKPPKKPRTTYTGYASIETDIKNKDIKRCKNLYFGYLASFEVTPETLFMTFLFESLESKKIPISQEIIENIHYINSKL